jgi:putative heme-binding domain-containing protein
LVNPDAKIAPGYGTVHLALHDGQIISGVLKSEEKDTLVVEVPDGRLVTVKADAIEERAAPRSAMPGMTNLLAPRELRDIVEFLSTLK